MKHIRFYIIPALAVLLVGIQFFRVRQHKQSRWKGGGFGMYSEIHYTYNEVRVNDLSMPLDSLKETHEPLQIALEKLKLDPSEQKMKEMAYVLRELTQDKQFTIQVWRPVVDAKASTYKRELLTSYELK